MYVYMCICVYVHAHTAGAPCPAATYARIHLDAIVTEVSLVCVCVYRPQRDKVQARKLSEDFSKTLAKFQEAVKVTLAKEREFVHPTAKRGGGGGGGGGGRLDEGDDEREGLLRAEEREREREQQDRLRMAQMMQADRDLDYSEAMVMCTTSTPRVHAIARLE